MDLFEYQANPRGSWVRADVAGCGVWLGVTRPGVAACGWATVAVGCHLGSQFGYLRDRANPPDCSRPAEVRRAQKRHGPKLEPGAHRRRLDAGRQPVRSRSWHDRTNPSGYGLVADSSQ